jgi:aminoglycoside phosphotransferase family enzyme
MGNLCDDFLRPGTLSSTQAEPVSLVETHISWVFLTATEVWKVKKPVDLGFLDFRTLAARKRACEAEVQLNRRLAEGVYLGVVPVVLGADGRHRVEGDGETVDWAVRMRRLPDVWRSDERLLRGELSPEAIDAIASHLARFHAETNHDATVASFGQPAAIRESIVENFTQTRHVVGDYLSPERPPTSNAGR